jgi:hypothetical protein
VGDEEPAFDAVYEVDAHPFGGTLRDALVLSDLTAWRNAVSQVQAPTELRLGGSRSAELQLHVDRGSDGRWVVEVRLRRSGDDPWPEIRYLVLASTRSEIRRSQQLRPCSGNIRERSRRRATGQVGVRR